MTQRTRTMCPQFSISGGGGYDDVVSRSFLDGNPRKKDRRIKNNTTVCYNTLLWSNDTIGAHRNHNRFKTKVCIGKTAISFDREIYTFYEIQIRLINCR